MDHSDIVHLSSRLFIVVVAKARDGGHVVVILGLGAPFVGRVTVGVLLYVLCLRRPRPSAQRFWRKGSSKVSKPTHP